MGHDFRRSLVVTLDGIPNEIDTGRNHEIVVSQRLAARESNFSADKIDGGRRILYDSHPLSLQRRVTVRDGIDRAPVDDHIIAEGTGHESPVRFDERYLKRRVEPLET